MLEKLIAQIMAGYEISKAEAKMLIDYDLGTLKQGAELIRRSYCGSTFDLCSIINGKSGRCSENCKYCAQSVYYQTGIDIYSLLKISEIKAIALHNQKQGVERFSIVTSGRKLNVQEFNKILKIYQELNDTTTISLCASLGLLNFEELKKLKETGVKRYHNNLETSRNYFNNVCTTHSYEQKSKQLRLQN